MVVVISQHIYNSFDEVVQAIFEVECVHCGAACKGQMIAGHWMVLCSVQEGHKGLRPIKRMELEL